MRMNKRWKQRERYSVCVILRAAGGNGEGELGRRRNDSRWGGGGGGGDVW